MIGAQEFQNRIARVREGLVTRGLDALIVVGDEYDSSSARYLSGYAPILEPSALLVPLAGDVVLLAGPECIHLARQQSWCSAIVCCQEFIIPGEDYPHTQMSSLREILGDTLVGAEYTRVGLTASQRLPQFIADSVRGVLGSRMVDVPDLMVTLRQVKSPGEIELLGEAFRAAASGISAGHSHASVGAREYEIASAIAATMWHAGPEALSHILQVASGRRSRAALSRPSGKRLAEGDLVVVDAGAVFDGYFSDMGRTFLVGGGSRELRDVLHVAERAVEAAIAAMRPGVEGGLVDLSARRVVEEAGMAQHMIYAVAHSVGLQHCEEPMCRPRATFELEPGMVFAVDVGLFDFDFGGVRIEEGVLVTESGARRLTDLPLVLSTRK